MENRFLLHRYIIQEFIEQFTADNRLILLFNILLLIQKESIRLPILK